MKEFLNVVNNHKKEIIDCGTFKVFHLVNKRGQIIYNTKYKRVILKYQNREKVIEDQKLIKMVLDIIK